MQLEPSGRRVPRRSAHQEHRHRRRARAEPARASRGWSPSTTPMWCDPFSSGPRSSPESATVPTPTRDVALRILADHARAMAMLVADGVLPSNDGRGYVLRRVIRRAVRRAFQLGVITPITPSLVATAAAVLGQAYPVLIDELDLIQATVEREEGSFRRTLASGSVILEEELATGTGRVPGEVAFRLHDTHGFPHRADHGDGGRGGGRGRRRRVRAGHGRPARAGPGRRPGPAGLGRGGGRLPRAARQRRAHRLHRLRPRPGSGHGGGRDGPGPNRGRSRSSSTAPRSTPSRGARWETPGPSPPRPVGPWSRDTQSVLPGSDRPPRPGGGGALPRPGRPGRHRRRPA